MTPGIHPSKVKMMLRKKLAMRPVMSTASGGSTTQKKYRSAFISAFSSSPSAVGRSAFSDPWLPTAGLRPPLSVARNLQLRDSKVDHGKGDASAVRAHRFVL